MFQNLQHFFDIKRCEFSILFVFCRRASWKRILEEGNDLVAMNVANPMLCAEFHTCRF